MANWFQGLVLAWAWELPPGLASAERVTASASASDRELARAREEAKAEVRAEVRAEELAPARAAVRPWAAGLPSPHRRHHLDVLRDTSPTRSPTERLLVFQRQAAYLWYVPS